MEADFFRGKKITVMGLGLLGGGVSVVRFLSKRGARVIVTDIKTKDKLATSLEKLRGLKNVEFVLGQHRREDFVQTDMVVKSPAVSWQNEHIQLALEKKIPVEMDSSLFFKMCRNPIIGVTGTKGKTTTSTLIYEILRSAGRKAVPVGISQTPVMDQLEKLEKESVVVFELSSWRLSALGRAKLSPQIAVLNSFLPDHLNYYKSMKDYLADKENIFLYQKSQDFLIYNADNPLISQSVEKARSQLIKFSLAPLNESRSVFLEEEEIYLNDGLDVRKVMGVEEIKLAGRHNLSNVLAAIGACFAYGLPLKAIRKGIAEFSGVPHRLEFVRELEGVKYYNDTAATIPEAMIQALEVFSQPIILIAGGSDKELDFKIAAERIVSRAKEVIFLKGGATEKILTEIKKILPEERRKWEFFVASSMEEAVWRAKSLAQPGEIILLSPGAASFGLFLNEFDRGEKFRQIVKNLK